MSENKRIFLTGALIAGLLLLTPFYLQLIGIVPEPEIVSLDSPLSQTSNVPDPLIKNSPYSNAAKSTLTNEQDYGSLYEPISFHVQTSSLDLILTNHGGGSIKRASLRSNGDDGYKYLGGYDEEDIYRDSINVSLILNPSHCSPCLSIDSSGYVFNSPFATTQANGQAIYNNESFMVSPGDSLVITMATNENNITIIKSTTFYGEGYEINHSFSVENSTESSSFLVSWLGGLRPSEKDRSFELSQYTQSYVAQEKNIEDLMFSPSNIEDQNEKQFFSGKTDWTAIRTKYFINAFIASSATSGAFLGARPFNSASNALLPEYSMGLQFSKASSFSFTQFLGPLDVDYISKTGTYLDRVMNFGWLPLQPFSRSVLWLLKALHKLGLNYGVILIIFAFLIRIITGPLTKKSHKSSQNMQKIQPEIKKIQEKHKNDSQRMNREVMKLYTEKGVNPLGGCLPMLIQMPLLFSLFIVFRSTIEFRGAPFIFWINNLSQPDAVFSLPFSVPIYGSHVAILPIFLGLSMFLSQKLSMATMDPKQKPMMYIMSAFFFLLFNQFPSGLNLYYMIYNLLNFQQQRSMKQGQSTGKGVFASFGGK